ncbi:type IX secretion system membrane protein PorP/SprF [Flavobacteriaceae bacterium]|nr:type IX secretion system membrane protein PorP/SprF [Flavobacteriaceae bacterium]
MKRIISTIIMVCGILVANAQQDPHYTMYMYNMNIVNPAYAGTTESINVGVLGRQQWVGVKGAPSTYTANIHSPISNGLGAGLSIITDEIGPSKESNIYADLSYKFKVSEKGKLSFGFKFGATIFNLDSALQTTDTEGSLNVGFNEFFPNVGAGLYYYTDVYYFGLSTPNLLNSKHIDKSSGGESASESEHVFVTTGYVFQPEDYLKVKPSLLTKVVPGAPVSVDLSLNFLYQDRFELGFSHRWKDSWASIVNILVTDDLRIGYAYDHTLSNLGDFNRGSHEIMILYSFNLSSKQIKSPRFF